MSLLLLVMTLLLDTLQRLTTYTFILSIIIFLYKGLPKPVNEIIRTLAVIVYICITYAYIRFGFKSVQKFYKQFGVIFNSKMYMVAFDYIVHSLPVLLIGLPTDPASMLYGYIIFVGWYMLVRKNITRLYLTDIPLIRYDEIIFAVVPVILYVYYIVLDLMKK